MEKVGGVFKRGYNASAVVWVTIMTKVGIIIEALASTPADISRIINPLLNHEQNTSSAAQPIKDLLLTLLVEEQGFNEYVNKIMNEDQPLLTEPSQHAKADSRHLNIHSLVDELQVNREKTVAILRTLSMKDWQRKAYHSSMGQISLRYLAQALVEQDIAHSSRLVNLVQDWRKYKQTRDAGT